MEKTVEIEGFKLIGISVRTHNAEQKAVKDLGELWERFFAESVSNRVENPISQDIYSVYTNYESDYKGEYTAFIGLKVDETEYPENGLESLEIKGGKFLKIQVSGDPSSSIAQAWLDIWTREDSLSRRYSADFEVYGDSSNQGKESIVDIFLSVD